MLIRAVLIAVSAAGVIAGCVPLPLPFYVGDESAGRLAYDSCSFGDIPEGLVLSRAGIMLLVSVRQWHGDEVVHIRYDVGNGHRAQLAGPVVAVDLRDGRAPRIGTIDWIDLWDRVPEDGYEVLPARSTGLGPPNLLMDDAQLPLLPTGWPASTILSARRQLSWPVEVGEFIDGQSVLAVCSLISFSTAIWQAKRVRP